MNQIQQFILKSAIKKFLESKNKQFNDEKIEELMTTRGAYLKRSEIKPFYDIVAAEMLERNSFKEMIDYVGLSVDNPID